MFIAFKSEIIRLAIWQIEAEASLVWHGRRGLVVIPFSEGYEIHWAGSIFFYW